MNLPAVSLQVFIISLAKSKESLSILASLGIFRPTPGMTPQLAYILFVI